MFCVREPACLWLRRDLRRRDLPALAAAADAAGDGDGARPLRHRPRALGPAAVRYAGAGSPPACAPLPSRTTGGSPCASGDPVTKVGAFAAEVGAGSVHVSAETTPYGAARDAQRPRIARGARRRLGRDRFAVRRGAGAGAHPAGRPLPRLHAVLPRLARARLGRARGRAARRTPGGGSAATTAPSSGSTRALDECPVDLPTAGEDAALRRWRAFRDEHLRRLRRRPRPTRPPWHLPALAVPQGRRPPPAHGPRRPRRRPVAARPRSSPTSWPGASSTPTSSTTTRPRPGATCGPSSAR